MERLFKRTPEHLDAIYEASSRHQLMADKFKCIWEPILLGSAQRSKLKSRMRNIRNGPGQRKRDPRSAHPPQSEWPDFLRSVKATMYLRGGVLTGELTLEPNGTHYNPSPEWDVMKLPGWLSADKATQERIVMAAEKYIRSDIPASSDWLGTRQWSLVGDCRSTAP